MEHKHRESLHRIDYLALSKDLTKTLPTFAPNFIRISIQQKPGINVPLDPVPINERLPIPLAASSPSMKLARNKLGKTLVKTIKPSEFNLNDPYLHQTKLLLHYEPLHDPALKAYFTREDVRQHLLKMGFISNENDVLCSMMEFYDYMRYLGDLYAEQTTRIKLALDDTKETRRKLKVALKTSQRYNEYLERREDLLEALQQRKLELQLAQQRRLERYRKNVERVNKAYQKAWHWKLQQMFKHQENNIKKERLTQERQNKLKQKQKARETALRNLIANKMEIAATRRNVFQMEAENNKHLVQCNFRNKHYEFRMAKSLENNNLVHAIRKRTQHNTQERIQQSKHRQEQLEDELTKIKAKRSQKSYEGKSTERIARLLTTSLNALLNEDELLKRSESSCRLLNLFDKTAILNAVRTSVAILEGLQLPRSTMNVIIEALTCLRGIAYDDPQFEIPKDVYVKEFIRNQITSIIGDIKKSHTEMVKRRNSQKRGKERLSGLSEESRTRDPVDEPSLESDDEDNETLTGPNEEQETLAGDVDSETIRTNALDTDTNSTLNNASFATADKHPVFTSDEISKKRFQGNSNDGEKLKSAVKIERSRESEGTLKKVASANSLDSCFDRESKTAIIKIDDATNDIIESAYSNDHYQVDLKSVRKRPPTPTSSVHSIVDGELIKFIEIIKQPAIIVPEHMNTREMMHVHDFQKRFIYTNLKRFKYYLKLKLEHDLNDVENFADFGKIEDLDKKRTQNIASIVDLILVFPKEHEKFSKNILLLSQMLCSEIFDEIQ